MNYLSSASENVIYRNFGNESAQQCLKQPTYTKTIVSSFENCIEKCLRLMVNMQMRRYVIRNPLEWKLPVYGHFRRNAHLHIYEGHVGSDLSQ